MLSTRWILTALAVLTVFAGSATAVLTSEDAPVAVSQAAQDVSTDPPVPPMPAARGLLALTSSPPTSTPPTVTRTRTSTATKTRVLNIETLPPTNTRTRPPSTTRTTPAPQLACDMDTHYVNDDRQCVPRPGGDPDGASALCKDGSYSYSQTRQGTCSGHQGVKRWL